MVSGTGKLFYITVNSDTACGLQWQQVAVTDPFLYLLLFVLHQSQQPLPEETSALMGSQELPQKQSRSNSHSCLRTRRTCTYHQVTPPTFYTQSSYCSRKKGKKLEATRASLHLWSRSLCHLLLYKTKDAGWHRLASVEQMVLHVPRPGDGLTLKSIYH